MGENLRLYRTMMTFIGSKMHFNDLRNRITFVWMVVGLILSKRIHLNHWALYRDSTAKASSRERQISRWLHNPQIEAKTIYRDLITAALVEWTDTTVHLVLDTSVLWNRFVIIRVALVYRGRALPLVWSVVEQSSASVAFSDYAELLQAADQLLPQGCRAILLADRGFAHVDLMNLVVELGWHFTLRAKQSFWVYRAFKSRCKMVRLLPPKGHVYLFHTVQVTQRRFGPVHLVTAHVRTVHGYDLWILISDRPTSLNTLDEYALRFDIEESFLDDKSAAFQLESSEVRTAEVLTRLLLVLATATLYLVSTGTAIVAMQRRHLVDTHWRRGLSYLQIGWRYLTRALMSALPLLSFPWLETTPDPEPVFASNAQARTPTVAFSAIYLRE